MTTTPVTAKAKKEKSTLRVIIEAILIALVIRTVIFQPFRIPSGSMKPNLLIGDYVIVNKWSYGYSRWSCPFGLCPISGRLFGNDPQRGDIAVFSNPGEGQYQNRAYVKRVLGIPGDTIEFKDGHPIINGQPVMFTEDLPYAEPTSDHASEDEASPRLCLRIENDICYVRQEIETLPNGVTHTMFNSFEGGRFDDSPPVTLGEGEYYMIGDNRDNSNDSRGSVGVVPIDRFVGKASIVLFSSAGPSVLQFWRWRSDRFFKWVR